MQHNDERPPTSGRPSLLSSEQQADTGGPRILGGFEGAPAGAGAGRARRSYAWVAAGVIALAAIGAASAVLLDVEGEKQIVLASVAPLPATPAPAAPLASEPVAVAPAAAEADEVSTAAILQDTPPEAPAKPASDELTRLLEHQGAAPARPVALARATPSTAASVKQASKPVVARKPPPPKVAAKPAPKPAVHALAAAPSKKKETLHPKVSSMDSDVTLLAALVAHSKATQPKKGLSASEKLKQCKMLGSVAEAEQCRARLCAGGAKNEAACKAPSIAKASTET